MEIRNRLKTIRRNMNKEIIQYKSAMIKNKLIDMIEKEFGWDNVNSIHVYLSQRNEVDTQMFIEYVKQYWPRMRIVHPPIPTKETPIFANEIFNDERGIQNDVVKYDVIIVPCIGFNSELYRIGYGSGYYDRFLYNKRDTLKIGLCFSEGFIDFAHEKHDINLDFIITE